MERLSPWLKQAEPPIEKELSLSFFQFRQVGEIRVYDPKCAKQYIALISDSPTGYLSEQEIFLLPPMVFIAYLRHDVTLYN